LGGGAAGEVVEVEALGGADFGFAAAAGVFEGEVEGVELVLFGLGRGGGGGAGEQGGVFEAGEAVAQGGGVAVELFGVVDRLGFEVLELFGVADRLGFEVLELLGMADRLGFEMVEPGTGAVEMAVQECFESVGAVLLGFEER
jgi:hypothetical protein